MTTMAKKECSYGAEKLSPRQKTWISAAEIRCPRRKNSSSAAEIGISGQKACSSAAVKHRPRQKTRIYATEIGIRRSFSNTNSCAPLVLRRFAESHELTTNFSLMIINGQLMVIIC